MPTGTKTELMATTSPKPAQVGQLSLWEDDHSAEDPSYLSKQLVTYIGSKRALLGHIATAVAKVKERMGKDRLRILDAFAGSGAVSRFFKAHSSFLVSNDIEDYAAVVGRCYLRNRSTINMEALTETVRRLNEAVDDPGFDAGFIQELYSPDQEHRVTAHDRVFYTPANARRLDNYRRLIETVPADYRDLLLGPLLSEASVHVNTAGVFKGFYKDRRTGVGRFGGSGSDALARITGEIRLETPVLSRFECEVRVHQEDANELVREARGFDLAYLDPPYNQHPYGSNYFMLNLLVHYRRPDRISKVSGIPAGWRRSDYNVRSKCLARLKDLLLAVDARFILLSFNDEGFVTPRQLCHVLHEVGPVETVQVRYNAFRGSRNLRNRGIHVTEHLFLVERG